MIGIGSRVITPKLGKGTIKHGPWDIEPGDVIRFPGGNVTLFRKEGRWWEVTHDMTGETSLVPETEISIDEEEVQPENPPQDDGIPKHRWLGGRYHHHPRGLRMWNRMRLWLYEKAYE